MAQETASPIKGGDVEAKVLINPVITTYTVSGASQTVTINAQLGNDVVINCTATDAYTVANPTGLETGQILRITWRNASGGTMGTPTFGNLFKVATFTKPANATSRTIGYRYNGTNLVELNPGADVAN